MRESGHTYSLPILDGAVSPGARTCLLCVQPGSVRFETSTRTSAKNKNKIDHYSCMGSGERKTKKARETREKRTSVRLGDKPEPKPKKINK